MRWTATARNSLIACVCVLGLAACEQKGAVSGHACGQLRERFDQSFKDAVSAGVRKARDEQKKFVSESHRTYLAMERQGCCAKEGVCPPLNVH